MINSWRWRLVCCAFSGLLCAGLCSAADLQTAKQAYEKDDYATALKEFSPLADQGDAEAQFYLGKMYVLGQGVLKDQERAVKLLTASAEQGNAEAQFFLGALYVLPHTDIAQGLKWLRVSAEQGNQDAQLLLGKCYLNGELPKDPVQADMWLRLAAEGNLEFYQNELRGAEKQMSPAQITKGKELAAAWKPKRATTSPVGTNPKS